MDQVMSVRDGSRLLRFHGQRLAFSSSERPGVQRWSELTLYQTATGEYLIQKVGRSTVAHSPECHYVTHRMPSWLDAREEGRVRRTPCVECQPLVGDDMDPHTRLEPQRYTLLRAATLTEVRNVLTEGRDRPPAVIARLLMQVS